MEKILNLTQHAATLEQVTAGVFEPKNKVAVSRLLTFDAVPEKNELFERANALANIAAESAATAVMIGGAPFFMSAIEREMKLRGIQCLYAFSRRESVDQRQADGSVVKTQVFRHAGFVVV
jgi:hypothetical protein